MKYSRPRPPLNLSKIEKIDSLLRKGSIKIKLSKSPRENPKTPLPLFMNRVGLRDKDRESDHHSISHNPCEKFNLSHVSKNSKISDVRIAIAKAMNDEKVMKQGISVARSKLRKYITEVDRRNLPKVLNLNDDSSDESIEGVLSNSLVVDNRSTRVY